MNTGAIGNFIKNTAPEAVKAAARKTGKFAVDNKKEIAIGVAGLATGFAAGELQAHLGKKMDKKI